MKNKEGQELRLRLPERSQIEMRFECADDLIPQEHPARLVWEVVQSLDLSKFYEPIKASENSSGRDATDPKLLVALWLYASIRGVGSARELERLTQESRPYRWLCGGVSVNHHLLSDFRVGRSEALENLFSQVIAVLVKKGLVKLRRLSQDGLKVRASAGEKTFRRKASLERLRQEARERVRELGKLLSDPAKSSALSARQKGAKKRAAKSRLRRVRHAIKALKELEREPAGRRSRKQKEKRAQPRASTTDQEARRMKMSDGGFRPAYNVQVASDTQSRLIVGVDACNQGNDYAQSQPMREQVENRTGQKVLEHLIDGGYLKLELIERAEREGVTLYVPPKPPRNKEKRGSEYEPRADDSEAIRRWRERMGSEEGKEIYKLRAATSETINADLRCWRGVDRLTVRGLKKVRCVMLWGALAYDLLHAGEHLLN
jgi:transposase